MILKDLVGDLPALSISGRLDRPIAAVALAAEDVEPGDLYVATEPNLDGGDLDVSTALRRGAHAVVIPLSLEIGPHTHATVVRVRDSRDALGRVLAAACDRPSQALEALAVTGTNGKTTTAWLLSEILTSCGVRTGLIGTVEIRVGAERQPASYTTPPARVLQPLLAEMRAAHCTHVVMEASSHGLALGRLAGTRIQVAGFTNLTRDHLDFHGTTEAYAAAKARLFTDFARAACIAIDDQHGVSLADRYSGPKLTVSTAGAPGDLRVRRASHSVAGTVVEIEGVLGHRTLELSLLGAYNVQNALVALGMAVLAGQDPTLAIEALARAKGAPGRCEVVSGARRVIVDYAHTPDALERVLSTLRPLTAGRLICIFGAGGERDKGKRPLMGKAVAELADLAVVTSDNPRSEPPESIIADIVEGMTGPARIEVEPDRRQAIVRAIRAATVQDIVLIAGKGHETTQTIQGQAHVFDDRQVAAEVLAGLTACSVWRAPARSRRCDRRRGAAGRRRA